jgi:parallel beta-helix repeat protein
MKNLLVVGVIVLFLVMCISSTTGFNLDKRSNIRTLNDNTLYVGGTGPGNYTSIQDAINNASDGDTVFVYDDSSPYDENIVINKPINLIGEHCETTIINGNKSGDSVKIASDNILIIDFTVENIDKDWTNGFKISNHRNCIIDSCISKNNGAGMCLAGANNNTIINCRITNNYYGIWLNHESNNKLNKILNCTIVGNSNMGIVFDHVLHSHRYNIIRGNIISNNPIGIAMITSNSNEITYNHISNSYYNGIWIETCIIGCDNQSIHHNNFINNSEHASDMGRNKWFEFNYFKSKGNYWDDWRGLSIKWATYFPFFYPYKINGIHRQFDWFPAQEPYDIEV